ncbi:uncharacterized protein LOC144432494 [Glandiceps talaboti]
MKWLVFVAFLLGSCHVNQAAITLLANSFAITDPTTYTITTTTAVTFTFSIGLMNDDTDNPADLTSISLYLSDDTSLSSTSDAFAVTDIPDNVAASADGTTATTGLKAEVTADAAKCSTYKYVCVKVVPDDAFQCTEDISASIDCTTDPANGNGGTTCSVLTAANNGVVTPADATSGEVTLSCKEGYKLSDATKDKSTCTDDGTWSVSPATTCVADSEEDSGIVPVLSTFLAINMILAAMLLTNM